MAGSWGLGERRIKETTDLVYAGPGGEITADIVIRPALGVAESLFGGVSRSQSHRNAPDEVALGMQFDHLLGLGEEILELESGGLGAEGEANYLVVSGSTTTRSFLAAGA